eukprot:12294737-Heterocapsa_arctica.AAC.1
MASRTTAFTKEGSRGGGSRRGRERIPASPPPTGRRAVRVMSCSMPQKHSVVARVYSRIDNREEDYKQMRLGRSPLSV